MTFERPLSYEQLDLFDAPISQLAPAPQVEGDHNSLNAGTPPEAEITPPEVPAPEPVQALPVLLKTPPTFAEAIAAITTWTDLTPTRRRDLTSAVNCVASKILHAPLANILCCPAQLNETLFQHPPAAFRMGRSNYRAVLSRLRAVLKRLGTHLPHELGEGALSGSWRDFLGHITCEPLRGGLRRFARYCTRAGIDPMSVTDDEFASFLVFDREGRLAASHAEQGSSLASAWRKAVRQQPDPLSFPEITAPRSKEPYTLEFSAYPAEFEASVEAYRLAVSKIDRGSLTRRPTSQRTFVPREGRRPGPFTAKKLPFRKLKPSSIKTRLFSIRQAAAALVLKGAPIEEITSLSSLVQPVERVQQIVDFYSDRADGAPGGQTEAIATVLYQIAKHHADVSEDDLWEIAEIRAEVTAPRNGEMGKKPRRCLMELWRPRARAILLCLPQYLEHCSRTDALSPIERARMMRAAVIIGILNRCPLRIGNLHSLRLDKHLTYLNGESFPSHILIEPRETKNSKAVSFPIPEDAARQIQRYLDESRPLLAKAGNPYLFPGETDGPLSINQTRQVFKDYVSATTGVDVYPHVMRHFAGLLFLTHHPGQYELLQRILGHHALATTKEFYTGLETEMANAMADSALLKEREAGIQLAITSLEKLFPGTTAGLLKSKG